VLTKPLLGVVGILAVALLWFYVSNLQLKNDLQVSVVKQEAAETSLRTAQQEADLVSTQLENFTKKMAIIEKERNEAQLQVAKMRDLFQDHDFAKLLSKKPGLVENLMQKKTKEVFDEIEALTTSD
jgi:hypothetical protein